MTAARKNIIPEGEGKYKGARLIISFLLILSCAGYVDRQEVFAGMKQSQEREQTAKAIPGGSGSTTMEGIMIPMRDGEELAADIWLPAPMGKFPTILMITPYNRKLLGASLPDPAFIEHFLDREHYAYVIVDWRGFFGSKKAAVSELSMALKGENLLSMLGNDGYDTVEWIASQPWSNGKVGMWGPSALGKIQYFTAAKRPPHLVCIVPIVSEYGYEYNLYFFGGVLKKGYVNTLGRAGYGTSQKVLEHPTHDAFWSYLERMRQFDRFNIPIFIISGWYDLYPEGSLTTFERIRQESEGAARQYSRLLIGPWEHTRVGKLAQGDLEFKEAENVSVAETTAFFDYWLRDKKENGWDKRPPVRYFQMGTKRWRDSDQFLFKGTKESVYYLHPKNRLARTAPPPEASSVQFRFDPDDPTPTVGGMNAFLPRDPASQLVGAGPRDQRGKVESRRDVLVYTSDTLDVPVDIDGVASVKLYVSSDVADTDFAIRLTDVYPDGRSLLITDGIQRMRYRSSSSSEQWMKPGEVYEVTVKLSVTSYTFLAGHRIRVVVSSSNYPRYDINPNVDDKKKSRSKSLVATNTVYHDKAHPSALVLPSMK